MRRPGRSPNEAGNMKNYMIGTRHLQTRLALRHAGLVLVCAMALLGCHQDMWNQPRYKAHAKNTFFADDSAARLPVGETVRYEGKRRAWVSDVYAASTGAKTVPVNTDDRFWKGKVGDAFVADNYFNVDAALLERGRERFAVTCMPCHGALGDGAGLIISRGFPLPVTYHIDRLREVEDGYIFDVITNGFGRMYSYAARVAPEDRWAIAAYIRALQYSQNAKMADLTPADEEAIRHPKPEVTNDEHAAGHADAH
jgi:mono/diheme cytochrome c family protein